MLRKTLTLGIVFILALCLLLVSMITCFTYEAEAHDLWSCLIDGDREIVGFPQGEQCWVLEHHNGTGG